MKPKIISLNFILLVLLYFCFSITVKAQVPNTGDCIGAIPVCNGFYEQVVAPSGQGGITGEINTFTSCLTGGEMNSGWYQITIASDGVLNFTLTPSSTDDYDWTLFNITNASCDDISTDPSIEVSCNSYGLFGANGPTGISSAEGGSGNENGPGNFNGPPFNGDITVLAGETYVLMVSNWTGTSNGYTLDFSNSTAGFLDEIPPEIESIEPTCNDVIVTFSENISCTTVNLSDFDLQGPGGPYTATSVSSNCENGANSDAIFSVVFDPPFPSEGGNYNLAFNAGVLEDLCGNLIVNDGFDFFVPAGMQVEASSFPASCSNANGSIEVNAVTGGTEPYEYSIGGAFQNTPVFSGLNSGDYTVVVLDDLGCLVQETVTVEDVVTNFTAGDDAPSCNLFYVLQATLPDNSTGVWTSAADVSFTDINSPHAVVTVPSPGVYTFIWTVTDEMDCVVSDPVQISFSDLSLNMVPTPATCPEKCDGQAMANVNGAIPGAIINYHWSNNGENSGTITELCPGSYSLTISNEFGCSADMPFDIIVPDTIKIQEVLSQAESCFGYCDGQLEVVCDAAVDFSFDGGETFNSGAIYSGLCAGKYDIIVKSNKGCRDSVTAELIAPNAPMANFNPKSKTASIYSPSFELMNTSKNYVENFWHFDFPETTYMSDEEHLIYTIPDSDPIPEDFNVLLTVIDEAGCTDSIMRVVSLIEEPLSFIPNSFTPNGDGLNDNFKPVLISIDPDEYVFEIFDRWGDKIFETNNVSEGWNGNSGSNEFYAPNGVYLYRIKAKSLETTENVTWNGKVMLIR